MKCKNEHKAMASHFALMYRPDPTNPPVLQAILLQKYIRFNNIVVHMKHTCRYNVMFLIVHLEKNLASMFPVH